ncbi:MAG: DUF5678 domain-containing protein [Candidatus Bathyarchaeia archaeon]
MTEVDVQEEELTRLTRYEENAKWLTRSYDRYRQQYGGEYVAVDQQQILDHDRNLPKLVARIKKQHKDKPIFIQYVYREKPRLIL